MCCILEDANIVISINTITSFNRPYFGGKYLLKTKLGTVDEMINDESI